MKREATLHVVKPAPEPAREQTDPAISKLWRDKTWRYVPANATDISKTFARIRRQQQASQKKGRK
jgi:hypothetical protein